MLNTNRRSNNWALIWCKSLLTLFGFHRTNLHISPFVESSDEEDNVENIQKRGEDFSVLLEKSGKDAVVVYKVYVYHHHFIGETK